ncbi:hypothetical protein [Vulcanisaeta souniana]|uniref:hypothetical protein n=1 Tax=Vulcanisaeta souniana TaxID=164452 RepID=UPI001FB3DD61|nr:hypothetical protein [Vulcanisaeta souniana]
MVGVSWLINDALKRLVDFVKLEVSTEELQKPPYESYAQIIQELNNRLSVGGNVLDKELVESTRAMIRETLAALIRRRIEKLMKSYELGREIPEGGSLFVEERRFFMPLLELRVLETPKGEARELAIVSFRKGFPVLYSVRLVALGPFSQFDVAAIPRSDAGGELQRRGGIIDIVR